VIRTSHPLLSCSLVAWLGLVGCHGDDTGTKAEKYCRDVIQQGCVRAFECVPPANRTATFTSTYGASLEGCQAKPNQCAMYPAACTNFDSDAASVCLTEFTVSTCAQLLFIDANGDPTVGLPLSCGAVCPPSP
jgi:hypothetical protein